MSSKQTLNRDWRFHYGDVQDAGFMGYDDRAWRIVTLPHDWAVEYPFDPCHASGTGYLPGGTAWYRKHFMLPDDIAGKCVRIHFLGVYKHAKVWVNSNYLGSHAYGYTSFFFDISEFVRPGENVIAVRVEHNDVADSRWYTGSGIDRDVQLEIADPVCFLPGGIFFSTQEIRKDGSAVLRIQYETANAQQVRFSFLDSQAEGAGPSGAVELTVSSPPLWSPDQPHLLPLLAQALANGQVTDEETLLVGIRVARFDADEGFFLNGQPMKIKGVCVHHDGGCLGAAVPKCVWIRRLKKFKEAGCNALRTAHNPPDPDLLDACDELGLMVMDEAFDEWEGIKNKWWQGHNVYPPKHFGYAEDFPQWHEIDLRSMILRDRNHPSIILWSIGNEIDYPNDPYVTPLFREALGNNDANKPLAERLYDVRKPDAGRLAIVAKKLTGLVHALDDTRPVTSALSFPELSNRTGYADVLDLSGYNYREHFYDDDHARYPGRVILGSENSHDPAAWKAMRDRKFISAQFLWTGIDFLGECQGWPIRISQAGMMNLAGFEKPLFYQRKALWTEDSVLRLAVCGAEEKHPGVYRSRFRWEGEEGQKKSVYCLTNRPWVKLFLNGAEVGFQTVADANDCCVSWEIPYAPGELKAVADQAEDALYTPKQAEVIVLRPDRKELFSCGENVMQVEVALLGSTNHPALDEIIHVQTLGDLTLLGIENGKPDDLTPYSTPFRTTLDGQAILYLRCGMAKGNALLRVWTDSGLSADLPIPIL